MTLETLQSNEFSNFIIYDTISATPFSSHGSPEASFLESFVNYQEQHDHPTFDNCAMRTRKREASEPESIGRRQNSVAVQGRKKRRRKPRVCKNTEEAETQRITHITVERNRRKQMNEHLAVLRSLMPESYVQRASIVGGAIEFVKELEHLLQSLEARKLQLLHQEVAQTNENTAISKLMQPPFAHCFSYPQYTWSQTPNKYTSKTKAAIADIEVTLIETHANLRILTRRSSHGQLTKLVAGFQTLCLTVLHLNVTTIDPLVFYSFSAKVEEGFQLGSVDGIATAVHHLLARIEEEASLCC
ncbi:transcription factor bHLH71-like isoform X2 [Glycine soja]|uniref:transcription factor bHLH71 isoform X2 n=1 Tax=Glycine max TaxID=3847 RepID=UPI0003DE8FD1|nr:transcription factor bHLH71 isoform X2 [Glycine max]XP_028245444.1 transcription factor bHLH71-like isoform X2 [Glycine soja]|eukprot:XP_006585890.1 transcription factor bHLH71 isoform X2 [Glycine max]